MVIDKYLLGLLVIGKTTCMSIMNFNMLVISVKKCVSIFHVHARWILTFNSRLGPLLDYWLDHFIPGSARLTIA